MNYMQAMKAKRDRANEVLSRTFIYAFSVWIIVLFIIGVTS